MVRVDAPSLSSKRTIRLGCRPTSSMAEGIVFEESLGELMGTSTECVSAHNYSCICHKPIQKTVGRSAEFSCLATDLQTLSTLDKVV